ncbi:MAG: hypothetical protein H5U18_08655, partial [Rhodobacteraceae bacterium]|nr:hypothetical protein [Paracoccaceae bacterium]
ARSRRSALHWTPRARRIAPTQIVAPRRVVMVPRRMSERPEPARPEFVSHQSPRPQPARGLPVRPQLELVPSENIFRDDPDLALAS